MSSYWYATNGMDRKRLSSCHLDLLDRAYERRTRVEIFDDMAFSPSSCAVANPYLGTMTAGDIHYGLYRHPSLARTRESSFDSLVLFDSTDIVLEQPATCVSSGLSALQNKRNQRNRFMCSNAEIDDDAVMGLVDHHRSRLIRLLLETSGIPNTTPTTSTSLGRRGSPVVGGTATTEDCVCCVIS